MIARPRSVHVPALPLHGGCSCGRVRYVISSVPLAFYLCHCTECQRHTSSAFGMSLRCEPASVEVAGGMRTISRVADSGVRRFGDFCPECGVRIQHRSEGDPSRLNIKAGTLDDTSWLVPAGHIWTASKQPHVVVSDDELAYERHATDGLQAIIERWRAMVENGRIAAGTAGRIAAPET